MKPVTVPTSLLIFNNINLRGFWLSRWITEVSKEERYNMYSELIKEMESGNLKLWQERHTLDNLDVAIQRAKPKRTGDGDRKVLLSLQK